MHHISRRAALCGIATIPAMGGATAALALPAPVQPEAPVTRVNALARELALAMDDWMDDISFDGYRPLWQARIFPASYLEYPVAFENVRARRPETPAARYERARQEMIAATKALHPEITDWRIMLDEQYRGEGSKVAGFFLIAGHEPKAVWS